MNLSESKEAIFPKGDKAPSDYFTGTAFIKMLVTQNPAFNTIVANVVFEPGCRNNWHTHKGGQILVCINGEGYFQEKEKTYNYFIKEMLCRSYLVWCIGMGLRLTASSPTLLLVPIQV